MGKFVFRALAASALFFASIARSQHYTLEEVAAPTGTPRVASIRGVTDNGRATGYVPFGNTPSHAFLLENGAVKDLGTLGGESSYGYGINENDQVAGASFIASTGFVKFQHAFLYSKGAMKDLGTLGGNRSVAYAMNAGGEITGEAETTDGHSHAFLYSRGKMQDLGTLGGNWSSGLGINDKGQVTGSSRLASASPDPRRRAFNEHAFLLIEGKMLDLGTLGGISSKGIAVNARGQVTGQADTISDDVHAFVYSGGRMMDLGTLAGRYSRGNGINSGGQVVGASDGRAFLYANGRIMDLNSLVPATDPLGPHVVLTEALSITEAGRIAATGFDSRKQKAPRMYLLTPVVSQ